MVAQAQSGLYLATFILYIFNATLANISLKSQQISGSMFFPRKIDATNHLTDGMS